MMHSKNLRDCAAQAARGQSLFRGNDSPRSPRRIKYCVNIHRTHAAHVQYARLNTLSREGIGRIERARDHNAICHECYVVAVTQSHSVAQPELKAPIMYGPHWHTADAQKHWALVLQRIMNGRV